MDHEGIHHWALCLQQHHSIIIMSTPAEYCKNCIFPFQQMGACPMPEKSIFWAYLSMLPYILPILILISSVIFRKFTQFKLFTLLASSYISGDKIVKNIIKSRFSFM
jgi:hypothetical protein